MPRDVCHFRSQTKEAAETECEQRELQGVVAEAANNSIILSPNLESNQVQQLVLLWCYKYKGSIRLRIKVDQVYQFSRVERLTGRLAVVIDSRCIVAISRCMRRSMNTSFATILTSTYKSTVEQRNNESVCLHDYNRLFEPPLESRAATWQPAGVRRFGGRKGTGLPKGGG